MMMKFAVAALTAAGLAMMAGAASAAGPIEGNWVNPSRTVTVHIGPCGAQLCGRVVSASAKARGDAAAAGTARLIGTRLMSGLEPTGEGAWRAEIFVPDRNLRAPGELHLTGPRTLDVQGCLGGLICKTQTWVKVAAPVKRKH
jgi:uncharacterized protein (DUF2147 family)